MTLIDGNQIAASIIAELKAEVGALTGRKPCIALVRVGDDPASVSYVKKKEKTAAENGVTYTSLDELLAASDIVSLHSPLFPETYHLLDAGRFARMKRGAYLINTSRGKLVDTAALIAVLKSGHLGGVALDVYEEEEGIFFEDHSGHVLGDDIFARLLTFPNVLVTSHQAFLTKEALGEIARVTVGNLTRIAVGEKPLESTSLG